MALEATNPIAQTFTIESKSVGSLPGVFLTQIGVYFKNKSSTLGAFCVVVQCNNGVPDTSKRMGSGHLLPGQILTSSDASAETVFRFQEPLMLQTDKAYAFYVYPDNNTPDFDMWVAEVGGKDVLTGQSVTTQPYSGVLFISSNGDTWTPIQTQDLKFNLYIAQFPVSTGKAVFRNDNIDFATLDLSSTGGIYRKTTSNPIFIGDIVYAANATNLTQILTDTTKYPVGFVTYVDEGRGTLNIRSNGKFSNTAYRNIRVYRTSDYANVQLITTDNLIANAIISTLDDIAYNAIVPKFKLNEPVGTYTDFNYYGTSNSTYTSALAKDTSANKVSNHDLKEFRDYERIVRSYSNEVATGGYGTKGTSTYEINLYTSSQYMTPVLDLSTKTIDYISNQINNDDTNEYTRYGNGKSKYISRTVVLDTVAEDLKVWVTGYRPAGTNIKVYGKFLNSQTDTDLFDNKPWTELTYLNNMGLIFSSPKDYEDYKDYQFGVSTSAIRPTSPINTIGYLDTVGDTGNGVVPGTLAYFDAANVKYWGFDTFSIKILLLSTDGANFPTMRDVRAVALQV